MLLSLSLLYYHILLHYVKKKKQLEMWEMEFISFIQPAVARLMANDDSVHNIS